MGKSAAKLHAICKCRVLSSSTARFVIQERTCLNHVLRGSRSGFTSRPESFSNMVIESIRQVVLMHAITGKWKQRFGRDAVYCLRVVVLPLRMTGMLGKRGDHQIAIELGIRYFFRLFS